MTRPGDTYGLLVVTRRHEPTPEGQARWRCRCKCGRSIVVHQKSLVSGNTRSCGLGSCHLWVRAHRRVQTP